MCLFHILSNCKHNQWQSTTLADGHKEHIWLVLNQVVQGLVCSQQCQKLLIYKSCYPETAGDDAALQLNASVLRRVGNTERGWAFEECLFSLCCWRLCLCFPPGAPQSTDPWEPRKVNPWRTATLGTQAKERRLKPQGQRGRGFWRQSKRDLWTATPGLKTLEAYLLKGERTNT